MYILTTLTVYSICKQVGDQSIICNFVAKYSDEKEGKHCLNLEDYGAIEDLRVDGRWVLLEAYVQ